jgi:uncharacterized Zn ribbon protein
MKKFKVVTLVLGFVSIFFLLGNSNGCGGAITPEVIQTGIATAQTILELLRPSVETAQALCYQLTKEESNVRAQARFECASINDAWNHVEALATALQTATNAVSEALKTGDQDKITAVKEMQVKAQKDLDEGVTELKGVLSKSPTVMKRE